MRKLQSGYYDIVLETAKPSDTAAAAKMSTDSVNDVEQRIAAFLEQERVHNVMLQDYLKALGTYTETVKYQERAESLGSKLATFGSLQKA
jgi:hypothetical protein